ncbi:MAG: NADH-quinone oxidoreductase subunit NuoH [Planctomycetota bacterium]|jgi:NADH-quinone oxidoreductase subunit H
MTGLLASADPTQWVRFKPEFLDFLPDLVFQAIGIFAVLQIPPALVVFLVWGERRISAWMQDRLGPNRVGPFGLLQSVADLVKFVFKEDVLPGQTTKVLFQTAPAMALIPAMLTFSMLPFSEHFMVSDLNVGLLMLFALSSLGVYGIQIGGWASNSKYSLIGGVRASAQIISYELTMGLAAAVVVLFTGSLNLKEIVMWQGDHMWVAFLAPAGFIAFVIFVTSAFAETNRLPFDMPEAESELAAGYHTEYSSMKFALFFLAEYTAMIVMSGLITTLFLGGWTLFGLENMFAGPDGEPTLLQTLVQVGIWWGKTICWLLIFIWVRWTLPRFRYDQLMRLGWKIFLPASLVNLLLAAGMRVLLDSTWYEV